MTGIYQIQSKVHPERIYVGSSINMSKRKEQHFRIITRGKHNPKIQGHCKKYGIDDLIFEIIEEFDFISKEHLLDREQFYLDTLKPWFNVCTKADSPLGVVVSDETRKKLSESHKGHKQSRETIEKQIASRRGKTWRWTEEAKAKKKGHGHSQTKETRAKISNSMKEVAKSPQFIANLALGTGSRTEESYKKAGEKQKGKHVSTKTRRKQSESAKKRIILVPRKKRASPTPESKDKRARTIALKKL